MKLAEMTGTWKQDVHGDFKKKLLSMEAKINEWLNEGHKVRVLFDNLSGMKVTLLLKTPESFKVVTGSKQPKIYINSEMEISLNDLRRIEHKSSDHNLNFRLKFSKQKGILGIGKL